MKTEQQMIKVIRAHQAGQPIERRSRANGQWVEDPSPAWDFENNEYREKADSEGYFCLVNENGPLKIYGNQKQAELELKRLATRYPGIRIVQLAPVMPGNTR